MKQGYSKRLEVVEAQHAAQAAERVSHGVRTLSSQAVGFG